MTNIAHRKMEKSNIILQARQEDLEAKQDKADHDQVEELFINSDLKRDRHYLQQNLDIAIRKHQREKENMERNFNQKLELMSLDYLNILEGHQQEASSTKNKLEERVENMTSEIGILKKKLSDKDIEISKMTDNHKASIKENKQKLIEEFDEIIKQILEENEQEIIGRDLKIKKLSEEKSWLLNDIDDQKAVKENNYLHQSQLNLKFLELLIDENTKAWRKKVESLELEKSNMERILQDYMECLETKHRDDLLEIDGKCKLTLEQKETNMDLQREQLKKHIHEATELGKALKNDMLKMTLESENELKIKLNEKAMKIKEEFKKALEEAVQTEVYNLWDQGELKEKNHQFNLEQKATEIASMQESLSRALARKREIGKVLHGFQFFLNLYSFRKEFAYC